MARLSRSVLVAPRLLELAARLAARRRIELLLREEAVLRLREEERLAAVTAGERLVHRLILYARREQRQPRGPSEPRSRQTPFIRCGPHDASLPSPGLRVQACPGPGAAASSGRSRRTSRAR